MVVAFHGIALREPSPDIRFFKHWLLTIPTDRPVENLSLPVSLLDRGQDGCCRKFSRRITLERTSNMPVEQRVRYSALVGVCHREHSIDV